jgi:hypothetical protein
MGTTPKPLKILITPELHSCFPVEELRTKGHIVEFISMNLGDPARTHTCPLTDDWDLILGPNCARFLPGMEAYLNSFVKGARAIKYKGKNDVTPV